jgi:uncharacterized integral membrane protein
MQVFMFAALAISFVAVLFALQNIVPVTVTFLGWRFEGSLALVLFVALVAGALISVLASVPTLVRGRWTTTHLRKQVATLEANLRGCRESLQAAQRRHTGATGQPDQAAVSEVERARDRPKP